MPEDRVASRRWLLALSVALLSLAGMASTARAQEQRRYWIESFDALIEVQEDGSLHVEERLAFVFEGSFNGVYRDIPTRVQNDWGLDYRIRLQTRSVTDDDGRSLQYEESWEGSDRRLKVWVPGAADATRTVVLRYRVERALRFPEAAAGFDAHDELYWNVTGTRWSVPIRSASATVILPPTVAAEPIVRAFSGRQGSRDEDVAIERESRSKVRFRTRAELGAGEGLTIVVGWPPGAVHRPTVADAGRELLRDNWPLGLPLLVLGLMLAWYRRVGRDPDTGRSIMVQYEPPDELRPAQLGTLIDEKVDLRDIVATVIDLAVRGYLRIEEHDEQGWFGSSTTVTELQRLRPGTDGLLPYEAEILEGLFERGEHVKVDDLKTRFYTRLGKIRGELYSGLSQSGLFRGRPDHIRWRWFGIAAATLAVGIALGVATGKVAFFFAAPACAVIVAAFAPFMPARTHQGRLAWQRGKGFEEFLSRTDGTRLRELGMDQLAFERFLPHAMALGVADQWSSSFSGLLEQPPSWYRGPVPGQFNSVGFGRRLTAMHASMGAAMATAPRSASSSSSGFSSGGGFSGGGFGGGGGGAF